eukprot:1156692-Pelagomonas_calceolata.AAC.2
MSTLRFPPIHTHLHTTTCASADSPLAVPNSTVPKHFPLPALRTVTSCRASSACAGLAVPPRACPYCCAWRSTASTSRWCPGPKCPALVPPPAAAINPP